MLVRAISLSALCLPLISEHYHRPTIPAPLAVFLSFPFLNFHGIQDTVEDIKESQVTTKRATFLPTTGNQRSVLYWLPIPFFSVHTQNSNLSLAAEIQQSPHTHEAPGVSRWVGTSRLSGHPSVDTLLFIMMTLSRSPASASSSSHNFKFFKTASIFTYLLCNLNSWVCVSLPSHRQD